MATFVKGVLFVVLLLASAVLGLHVLFSSSIVLYFIAPSICRSYVSSVQASWASVMSVMFAIFGIKVIACGDVKLLRTSNPVVVILNHRTRFDWLFLFSLWYHVGSLKNLRIILKSSLKPVPIFGSSMQLLNYIFLQRNWAQDRHHLLDSLHYYSATKFPVQLVLFPEGTDFSESNRKKDKEYAVKENLPPYQSVLHPRTTGFVQSMQALRGGTTCSTSVDVCDVTIGYVGDIPQAEIDLIRGRLPSEIHFHIKHYPSPSLPSSDEELSEWLRKRWSEKDELLTQFYQTKSFPGPFLQETWWSKMIKMAVLVKWLVLCAAVMYSLIQAPLLMTCVLGTPLIIHYTVTKWFDGWDKLTLRRWKRQITE